MPKSHTNTEFYIGYWEDRDAKAIENSYDDWDGADSVPEAEALIKRTLMKGKYKLAKLYRWNYAIEQWGELNEFGAEEFLPAPTKKRAPVKKRAPAKKKKARRARSN